MCLPLKSSNPHYGYMGIWGLLQPRNSDDDERPSAAEKNTDQSYSGANGCISNCRTKYLFDTNERLCASCQAWHFKEVNNF